MQTHKKASQLQIFLAFFRVGIFGYGGGPSSIPLVYKEVVENYQWLNSEEFGDILAIGNTLPGPIATKMASYIGYRLAGIPGMLNALLATISPSILFMIFLFKSLSSYKDQPWVRGMTNGVMPVVGMMMAILTWQFFEKSKEGLGWRTSLFLLITSFLLMGLLNIHPGIVISALLVFALLSPAKETDEKG